MRYGTYTVHPWFLDGRRSVVIQRHRCNLCSGSPARGGKASTYSEQSPLLVRGSWYAREVHRLSIDLWSALGGGGARFGGAVSSSARSWADRSVGCSGGCSRRRPTRLTGADSPRARLS